jgi:ferredoxin-type protein NapH
VSWIYAHRYLLARRATVLGTLVLFWLGANAHLGVLTGNLSSSGLWRTVPLTDPYATLQILATGQLLALTAIGGALIVLGCYALVGGRVFCGWFCPVGPLADASRCLEVCSRNTYHFSSRLVSGANNDPGQLPRTTA